MPADRVPYPCRVWTRVGLNCPPGFLALVEDDEDDDDDDPDGPGRNAAVGRRIRRLMPPNATEAQANVVLSQVFDEVQEILDRRTVLQHVAWQEFDTLHTVRAPTPTTTSRGSTNWRQDVALAGVIVLAAYGVYRGLYASGTRRLATGSASLAAAGIIAPFLAGLESQPRTLSLVPAYAHNQYQERRRRRLDEEQSGQRTSELLFEEPPGGGAPGGLYYMWYDETIGGRDADGILLGFVIRNVRNPNALKALNWVIRGQTREEVRAEIIRLSQSEFDKFYRQLVKEHSPDPIGGHVELVPGSEEESANIEQVDESVPVGNRW